MVFQFQQTLIILTQSIKTFGDVLMSVVFLKILGIKLQKKLLELPIHQSLRQMKLNTPAQVFGQVTLPLSVPGIISGFTMVFVPAVSTFYISQKMGSAGTTLIGDVIESQFKAAYNPNLGAALSLVLMVMVLVCIAVMNRFSDEEEVATI